MKIKLRLPKVIFVLLLLSIITSTSSAISFSEQTTVASSDYRIGSENVLMIDVYCGRDKNMNHKVRVSSKGVINFPLLGEVKVGGLTIAQLENKLTILLKRDYIVNPQVSVFIEEYSNVSILGQIREPGSYPIRGNLSVVELISQAGGFTKIAYTNDVKIIRTNYDGTKKVIKVKVHDVINRGKQEEDVQLEAGDIVTVAESFF